MGKAIRINHSIHLNKYIKSLLLLMVLLTLCLPQNLQLQESPCSEPKVAVFIEEIDDAVFDHLYRQHPFQPKEAWLGQIQDKVMQELRKNSPIVQFISTNGRSPEECEYEFHYSLALTTAGEEKEIAGLKKSAYTTYWMISGLGKIGKCRVPPKIFNHANTIDNPDIFRTIEQNIAAHGNISDQIKEYEKTHLAPARGPELEVSQEPEKVSPLEEENKLDIKIKVINCNGESVYDERYGQYIFLPRKTERGELSPTEGFNQKSSVSENLVTLRIISPEGASATYTLKKGIDPGQEQVKISACGLDENAVTETEIHINGLEIKVTPRRRTLRPGEKTQIQLEFSKVDEEGNKEPVAEEKLKLEVKGLIDGSVSPEGDIQTDGKGMATLTYRAGDKDKKITIQAEYKPKDFPDTVKGKASVKVIRGAVWTGTVTYTRSYNKKNKAHGPDGATVTTQTIVTENADFQIQGFPFSYTYDAHTGTDLYYKGDENSVTGSYSGTYKKITTIQREDGTAIITDNAKCQSTIRDSGYLVINNEEMRAHLDIGMASDEQCSGQTTISGQGGSHTMDFVWDQLYTFMGVGFLDSSIPAKKPRTVTGSFHVPEHGITWAWNLTLSGR